MFEKTIRGIALTMLIGSALFLALSALGAGCVFGGVAGWASLHLLHVLAPRYFDLSSWSLAFVAGGAVVGGLGALFGLGRIAWPKLKQSGSSRLRAFTRQIKRLWRTAST